MTIITKKYLKKSDITIAAIPGLEGLTATYKAIEKTKKIAIANKETIICAWDLIKKLIKYNTVLFPIDSVNTFQFETLNNNNDLINLS